MNALTKVACRGVGITGFGFALYDACNVAKLMSKQQAEFASQKHQEDAFFSSYTIDDVSYNQRNIGKKVYNLRAQNPLPSLFGRIKGGIKGLLSGLGTNLILTICSALALISKGFMAKVGMAGVACCGIYSILRQGFGLGKKTPMN